MTVSESRLDRSSSVVAMLEETSTNADVEPRLLVPVEDEPKPELSIVIPALNEQAVIGDFIDWCRIGLRDANVRGEILIVDSSTDRTGEIAIGKGARVLKTARRGLGRAYADAFPHIRGDYVLMGDADCTYDFRALAPFVGKFRDDYEFVMGSRFRGSIEPGSMPALHRYLGTPVTTWILNVVYGSNFSDIHCGMRGISREALGRMRLESQSWDYASEMVLKSVQMRLRTTEVPVSFLRDRNGRVSHHKRSGWASPWHAAWINLRAMFVGGSEFFVFRPGLMLMALGLTLTLPLSLGPVTIGPITFSLYWMLLGLTITLLGIQSFFFGCIAQVLHDQTGVKRKRWLRIFPYTRTVLASVFMFFVGVVLSSFLVADYVRAGFALPDLLHANNYLAVTGLLLMIAGFTTFAFTLLLHGVAAHIQRDT